MKKLLKYITTLMQQLLTRYNIIEKSMIASCWLMFQRKRKSSLLPRRTLTNVFFVSHYFLFKKTTNWKIFLEITATVSNSQQQSATVFYRLCTWLRLLDLSVLVSGLGTSIRALSLRPHTLIEVPRLPWKHIWINLIIHSESC